MNHGDKDAISRWVELHREALSAEWNVPEGRLGSVIRQLRRRAMIASTRASALLFLMVLVIFAGLFYYIGEPIWQDRVDGRRAALEQLLERTAAEHNELTARVGTELLNDSELNQELQSRLETLWSQFETAADLPEANSDLEIEWVLVHWDNIAVAPVFGSDEETFLHFATVPDDHPAIVNDGSPLRFYVDEDDQWGTAFTNILQSARHTVHWRDWLGESVDGAENADLGDGDAPPSLFVEEQIRDLFTQRPLSFLFSDVDAFHEAVKEFVPSRALLSARQDVLADEYEDLQEDGFGLLDHERQLRNLADFMVACRGNVELVGRPETAGSDTTPLADGEVFGAITTACAQAYQAQVLEENDNLWEIMAIRVPPGFLLLFLLVTLGGLYRYSIRLASFNNSRADVLEMLSNGRGPDDPLNDGEWKNLRESALSFAGDRVEFGATTAGIGPGGLSFGSSPKATKE